MTIWKYYCIIRDNVHKLRDNDPHSRDNDRRHLRDTDHFVRDNDRPSRDNARYGITSLNRFESVRVSSVHPPDLHHGMRPIVL
ncbi:MAG: hypothetical protein GY820_05635 [Gammaproteobacteria bacterium]|nr:hypothetical protein [Gammaproteobacteria bacterium]